MSTGSRAVQWSPYKRAYDLVAAGAVVLYLAAFVAIGKTRLRPPEALSDEVLVLRATGSASFVLLTIILCVGPLARLDRRFLPVLFNRRHLGVLTFLVALTHGILATGYYHGFGVLNPLVSLLGGNTEFGSLRGFPFQLLGLAALIILFLLAATSHDFWLRTLSPGAWKAIHMLIYPAYALLIGHVTIGSMQHERGALVAVMVGLALATVAGLHLAAGFREATRDRGSPVRDERGVGWIDAGLPGEIPLDRARTVCAPGGERIAVFRHAGGFTAVSNVCAHQGGPLGEGAIIDGCITCPWHGWQYRAESGVAPPPFTERVATYEVRISAGRLEVRDRPTPPNVPAGPRTEHDER